MQASSNPWERGGWLLGAIWIVYIVFPLSAAVKAPATLWARTATIVALAVFAVIYVLTMYVISRKDLSLKAGIAVVAVLIFLALACMPVISYAVLSLVTYVVAVAMFVLPRFAGVVMGCVGVSLTLIPLSGAPSQYRWSMALLVTVVAAMTYFIRVVDERSQHEALLSAQLGLVAERERVARDVHDVLGHSLTVVTMKAELAERLVDQDPERAKQEMAEVQSLARQSLAEIRATVAGLRVARLSDELAAAEVALAGSGIDAELPESASVVDPRHRIVIAWSLREAITNVVRHARASRCTVTFSANAISVADDGCGISQPEGNGLRGLRERVTSAGGTVTLATGLHGRGTTLTVEVP